MSRRRLLTLCVLAGLALLPDPAARRAPLAQPHPLSEPVAPAVAAELAEPPPPVAAWRRALDVLVSSVRAALAANVTDVAAALAYYAFLAIPAVLLLAVGIFGQVAGPDAVQSIVDRLDGVVPDDALTLIQDTLTRVTESSGGDLTLALVGFVLALWTASGAMSALMRGLNRVHDVPETRSFAQQRLTALALLAWGLVAVLVSFGLLVLGAPLSQTVGEAVDAETLVDWLWWAAQWPILAIALVTAVAGILRAGPAGGRHPRRAVIGGSVVAAVIWVAASGLFAIYVSRFGSYGAAWGSLSAVIVMLVWLWLTSLAILLGAQVEAEIEGRAEGG
jgi:membrane protein